MDLSAQPVSLLPAGAALPDDDMSAYLEDCWGWQIGSALSVAGCGICNVQSAAIAADRVHFKAA